MDRIYRARQGMGGRYVLERDETFYWLGGDIFRNDQIANIVLNGVNGTGYNFAEVQSAAGVGSGLVLAAELLNNTGNSADTTTSDATVHGTFTTGSARRRTRSWRAALPLRNRWVFRL